MGRVEILEEMGNDALARAGNKRVAGMQKKSDADFAFEAGVLQFEERCGVQPAHLAAGAGRANDERVGFYASILLRRRGRPI